MKPIFTLFLLTCLVLCAGFIYASPIDTGLKNWAVGLCAVCFLILIMERK